MKLDESVQVLNKSRALYDVADISGSQTVVPGLLQVVLKVISILAFIYFLEIFISDLVMHLSSVFLWYRLCLHPI